MAYIIAVDDDPEVLGTLGRVLDHENFEVSLASSGAEALDIMENRKPDLVILDIIMPEMGGGQCLKELLAIDPQVKVVVASGYSMMGSVRNWC